MGGGQGPGGWAAASACLRGLLGSLPARARAREPGEECLLQEFKLHWAWQGAPPPRPANKAVAPRVELWELQGQVPLVAMTAGRPGGGPPGRGHPCQGHGRPAPGQRLSL